MGIENQRNLCWCNRYVDHKSQYQSSRERKRETRKKRDRAGIKRKKKNGRGIIYHLIKYIHEHDQNEHIGNVNFSRENASCLPNCNAMP